MNRAQIIAEYDEGRRDFRDADLSGADLTGANLSGANLAGANLAEAVLTRANLTRANLTDAHLKDAHLKDVDLTRAVLTRAVLTDAVLRGANLRGAVLTDATLIGACIIGADLSRADLRGAVLTGADLRGAVLRGAALAGTCLDPHADVPQVSDEIIEAAGLEIRGDRVHGWRTLRSQHCGSTVYEPGEYVAPYFSVDASTTCHPGLYLASRAWLEDHYSGEPIVRCYCLRAEMVSAGDKWRAKRLWVVE